MILNMKKSGYMIFNPSPYDIRNDLNISGLILSYKKEQTYLGLLFNDAGNISCDIEKFIKQNSANITITLKNFLIKHHFAPIHVKYKVLDACVNSALLYGCETWSYGSTAYGTALHRKAMKMVLGLRSSTPNDIVYIETGLQPIETHILSRQLKYWKKVKTFSQENPSSPIAHMLHIGHN